MNDMLRTIAVIFAIWTFASPFTQAGEQSVRVSADAMIRQGIDAADPTGNPEYAEVGTRPGSNTTEERRGYMRMLVRVDLSELPDDADITSAKLRIRRAYQKEEGEGLEDETINVSAYRLLKDWGEGRPDGASWSWAKRDAIDWSKPGADATDGPNPDRAAEPTDVVNALDLSTGVYNLWDVTEDVRAMLAGEVENHGWILVGPEVEHGADWVRYRTRENAQEQANADYYPTLEVTWTAPSAATESPLRAAKGEIVPHLQQPNMLSNGDFDDGLTGWTLSKAEGVEATCEIVNTEHGPALRVRRTQGEGPIRVITDAVAVEPNTGYLLTGLYHTTDASYGSLAEFAIVQNDEPDMSSQLDAWMSRPARYGHVGHWTLFNRPEGEWERKTRTFSTRENTRYVRLAITLEGPTATVLFDNLYLAESEPDNREWSWPTREQPLDRDEATAALQARPDTTAEVKLHQDVPKLHLDDQPAVPQFHMADVVYPKRSYVRDFGEHGVNIHMITLFNTTQQHWYGKGEYDFEKIDEIMWNAVARNPDGHFVIYINLLPYSTWHEEHPEHAAQNSEGEYATSRHDHYAPPSYWSPEYQRQVAELLEAYVKHIHAQPYGRSVVGYFLGGGEDGQFYYQVISGQRTLQDGNAPGARPLLTKWLKDRYPEVQDLREAWDDPELTHETAEPAIENSRYDGTFFNPATQRPVADHLRFLNEEMGRFLSDMGRVCKEAAGKPIVVGAYYGRGNSFMVYPQFAQTSVMFDSPWIDYMGAQPGYYGYREAGSIGHINWVIDSLRLHHKIPMTELDFRTWISQYKSLNHDFKVARYWHADELRGAIQRDTGKLLNANGGAWWMEMSGGWFHDPEIMNIIKETHDTSQAIYESDAGYTPADVVFVTDEDNFFWTTEQVNVWNGPTYHAVNIQQRAIYRSGLKFDHYYLSDLVERGMDDYKVYVFLNLFYPDEKERQFIESRLKRDDKLLVWQYAPGYLTAEGYSTQAMADLTGIRFATTPGTHYAGLRSQFIADPAQQIAQQLVGDEQGQPMGYGVNIPAQRFTVDDENAIALATYTEDGEVSSAIKQLNGYSSLFVGHPSGFTPAFLQNTAQFGGVHAFIEPGDLFMFHRDDLIVLHGIEGGAKTLRLPFDADILDAFTGEVLAQDARSLPIELTPGETRWLRIRR